MNTFILCNKQLLSNTQVLLETVACQIITEPETHALLGAPAQASTRNRMTSRSSIMVAAALGR